MIEMLREHVNKYIIYFDNADPETLNMLANLDSNNYLCFDTESCADFDNNDQERVWCWSMSNTLNDLVIYGYTLDHYIEFMETLYTFKNLDFAKHKKSKQINMNLKIWVHNLGWDFEFLKYWLEENSYKYYSKVLYDDETVEDEQLDCNSWNVVENNGQVYNAAINIKMPELKFGKKKFKSFIKIKMYDSAKLIPDKLDTIGKKIIEIDPMFNKLEVDEKFYKKIRTYNYEITEIEKCYIYNDVYILKEFIKQYYIENNLKGFTASGVAFNNMLDFKFGEVNKKYDEFLKIYPEIKDKKVIDIIDRSYSGGYTFCNPKTKGDLVHGLGHSIDRNSSYPAAMMNNKMPFGEPQYFEGEYKEDPEYDVAFLAIHFDGFRRKNNSQIGFIKIAAATSSYKDFRDYGYKGTDYAASNFDDQGELITYNYNLVYTLEELEMLKNVYDFYTYRKVLGISLKGKRNLVKGLEYVDGVKFQSKVGDFGEFIEDCVYRKNKYKDEENECGKQVAKRDMNSLYGKLGSGYERVIMKYSKGENGLFKHERKYENDRDFDYLERKKYYRAFASFTTSYGRIALQSIIIKIEEKFGEDYFLYSDTDSIYANLTVEEFKSMGIDLDPVKLGAWEIEKEFTKFKCLGAKKYILQGKEFGKEQAVKIHAHCAGLTVEAQKQLNFDNFQLGAIFHKKQKRKLKGGYRLEDIEFTLKEFTFFR